LDISSSVRLIYGSLSVKRLSGKGCFQHGSCYVAVKQRGTYRCYQICMLGIAEDGRNSSQNVEN